RVPCHRSPCRNTRPWPAGSWPGCGRSNRGPTDSDCLFDQFDAIGADAVDICEYAEPGVMQDVDFAFQVLQAEDGVQVGGEYRPAAVGMPTQDPAFGGIGAGQTDVHRVL